MTGKTCNFYLDTVHIRIINRLAKQEKRSKSNALKVIIEEWSKHNKNKSS